MNDNRVELIRRSVERLRVVPNQLIELRALNISSRYGRPYTAAGWFDDIDKLTHAAVELEDRGAAGVYLTLNVVNPELAARAYNRTINYPAATTSDKDIERRVWLPFDFDPVRPRGISSTDEELKYAKECALDAADWLTNELGEPPVIWGFSANGYHLLLRIGLPNDEASTQQVKQIIEATSAKFTTSKVSVDRAVFNAARVWRLYGSKNRKGDEVPHLGRVHRRSRILGAQFADDHAGQD